MNLGAKLLGTESIDYQGTSSKFATELVEFVQNIIDLRDDKYQSLKKADCMKATRDAFDKDVFSDILSSHTGLSYETYVHTGSMSYTIYTTVTADKSFSSLTTGGMYKSKSNTSTFKDRLDKLNKEFDSKAGKVKKGFTSNDVVLSQVSLHLCLDTLFLPQFYAKEARVLTAPEIVGIVLHEVGHNITFIDRVGFLHRTLTTMVEPISVNIKSAKDVKTVAKDAKFAVDKVSDFIPKKQSALYYSVIESLESSAEDERFARFSIANVMVISVCFIALLNLIAWILACKIYLLTMWHYRLLVVGGGAIKAVVSNFYGAVQHSFYDAMYNDLPVKDSDFKHLLQDGTDIEFEADRFAVMHGMGVPLSNGLDTLTYNKENVFKHTTPWFTPTHASAKIQLLFTLTLLFGNSDVFNSSGNLKVRKKQIGKSILAALRAENLPDEMEKELLLHYKEFQRSYDNTYKISGTGVFHAMTILHVFNKIVTVNGLLSFIVNGKRHKDYLKVMEAARDLSNSELIVHRKKLEQLLK